jgi:hypothetical protein
VSAAAKASPDSGRPWWAQGVPTGWLMVVEVPPSFPEEQREQIRAAGYRIREVPDALYAVVRVGLDGFDADDPDSCWRCDAKGAETDVGLCTSCHDDLRTP